MVSQVVCVVCSVVPEPHTTEITFYKFPKTNELPALFDAWKNAITKTLANDRPELLDASFCDAYVCSRHFVASDFSFDGKLVLLKDAVPSRISKDQYENVASLNVGKEYEPTARGDNFASTFMKQSVTISQHKLTSDLISTGTTRILTPSIFESISSTKSTGDGIDGNIDILNVKKRQIDLEHKIESYGKIFKRLRNDNLLTESYVDTLMEQMPEAKQILKEVLKQE